MNAQELQHLLARQREYFRSGATLPVEFRVENNSETFVFTATPATIHAEITAD